MVGERLERLADSLQRAGLTEAGADFAERRDASAQVLEAATSLGKDCVDALAGLVLSGAVEQIAPRQATISADAPPLLADWQVSEEPHRSLAAIAEAQRQRLLGLSEQPNQIYRRLHESVALAADVAAWTSWSQDEEAGEHAREV
jgi:hypothetical protein